MKGVASGLTRGIHQGTILVAADNSGARRLKVISVRNAKGRKKRYPAASLGDLVACSVVEGKEDIRKTVVQVVVIRQKMIFRRRDGTHVSFEDNAGVLIKDDLGNPKGTLIKGPLAKEASERWPMVGKLSRMIV